MASLKLLWDAARTPGGKQEWEKIGLTHARTVARQHFRCGRGSAVFELAAGQQLAAQPAARAEPQGRGTARAMPARAAAVQGGGCGVLLGPSCRRLAAHLPLAGTRAPRRPDGSTYHVVRFKRGSGEVEDKSTHQGHSPSSTWAR